jgi:hypothetical protein
MDNWAVGSLKDLQKLRNRELSELGTFLDRRKRLLDIDKREGEVPEDVHLSDSLKDSHLDIIRSSLSALADYEAAMRTVEMSCRGVRADDFIYPVEA